MKNSKLSSSGALSESEGLDNFLKANVNDERKYLKDTRMQPKLEQEYYQDYYDEFNMAEEDDMYEQEERNPYEFEIQEDKQVKKKEAANKNKYLEKKKQMQERRALREEQERREEEERKQEERRRLEEERMRAQMMEEEQDSIDDYEEFQEPEVYDAMKTSKYMAQSQVKKGYESSDNYTKDNIGESEYDQSAQFQESSGQQYQYNYQQQIEKERANEKKQYYEQQQHQYKNDSEDQEEEDCQYGNHNHKTNNDIVMKLEQVIKEQKEELEGKDAKIRSHLQSLSVQMQEVQSLTSKNASLQTQLSTLQGDLEKEQSLYRELLKENQELKGQNESSLKQMETKMMAKHNYYLSLQNERQHLDEQTHLQRDNMILKEQTELLQDEIKYLRTKVDEYKDNETKLMNRNTELARGRDFVQEEKIRALENRLQEREIVNYDQDYDKEIQLQDMMIKGYQLDNQKLLNENKVYREKLDKALTDKQTLERQQQQQYRDQSQMIGHLKEEQRIGGETKLIELKREYALREELEQKVKELKEINIINQTKLDTQAQQITTQEERLRNLIMHQEKIEQVKAEHKAQGPQAKYNQYSDELKKIKRLEKKIETMERVFNKKDSALLRKINQQQDVQALKEKIRSMKQEHESREDTWQNRLSDLKLEYDQMKLKMEEPQQRDEPVESLVLEEASLPRSPSPPVTQPQVNNFVTAPPQKWMDQLQVESQQSIQQIQQFYHHQQQQQTKVFTEMMAQLEKDNMELKQFIRQSTPSDQQQEISLIAKKLQILQQYYSQKEIQINTQMKHLLGGNSQEEVRRLTRIHQNQVAKLNLQIKSLKNQVEIYKGQYDEVLLEVQAIQRDTY